MRKCPRAKCAAGAWQLEREGEPEGVKFARRRRQQLGYRRGRLKIQFSPCACLPPIADIGQFGNFERMKHQTDAEVVAEVRAHIIGNRREIQASKFAGCVSCCERFDAVEVVDWKDEWAASEPRSRVGRWTAKCPRCGQASVIGSSTGLLDDQAYEPVVKLVLERAIQRPA